VCLLSVVYSPLPSTRWRPSSPGEREKKKKGKNDAGRLEIDRAETCYFSTSHTQHEKWKEKNTKNNNKNENTQKTVEKIT
jgi:hypothetical protein